MGLFNFSTSDDSFEFGSGSRRRRDDEEFDIMTGTYREEDGRFAPGRAPRNYDRSARRFRDQADGQFEDTPDDGRGSSKRSRRSLFGGGAQTDSGPGMGNELDLGLDDGVSDGEDFGYLNQNRDFRLF